MKKLSRRQRQWVLRRDDFTCRFPVWVGDHFTFCGRTKDLEVHHILPQGALMKFMPDKDKHTPNNLVVVCQKHHDMIHPDMYRAKMDYPHNKRGAYSRAFAVRKALSDHGEIYWNASWDLMLKKIVQRRTARYLNKEGKNDPFPYS